MPQDGQLFQRLDADRSKFTMSFPGTSIPVGNCDHDLTARFVASAHFPVGRTPSPVCIFPATLKIVICVMV